MVVYIHSAASPRRYEKVARTRCQAKEFGFTSLERDIKEFSLPRTGWQVGQVDELGVIE